MYTERQKKLITSSGRRSLKSTMSKLMIFGHKLALILLTKNIWKTEDFLVSKRRKMRWNPERYIFENRRNCSQSELWASSTEAAYSEHSIAIHSISIAGYVNAVRAFVCFELPAREASSFCDFLKLTSCDEIAFISLLLRTNLPNMCPNMIHVDAFDFSACHSEEEISFFWRSVYIHPHTLT